MPVDVLERDGAVVDQNPHRERKAPERHHVDGLAEPGQGGQREQYGERDLDHDDQSRAPTAKEQKDHQSGQRCGYRAFADHPSDGGPDEG